MKKILFLMAFLFPTQIYPIENQTKKPLQAPSYATIRSKEIPKVFGNVLIEMELPELFEVDPLLTITATQEEMTEHPANLKRLDEINLDLLGKGETSIIRGGLTCKDVLSGVVSMPPDVDSNLICQNCYSFCMMKLVILQYVETGKKNKTLSTLLERKSKADLVVLDKIIPSLLDACAASFWAFRDGNLRQQLNDMQQKVQNESGEISGAKP